MNTMMPYWPGFRDGRSRLAEAHVDWRLSSRSLSNRLTKMAENMLKVGVSLCLGSTANEARL